MKLYSNWRSTVGEDKDIPPIMGLYPGEASWPRPILSVSDLETAQQSLYIIKKRVSHVSGHHRIMEPPEGALVTMVLEMGSKSLLDARIEIRS